MATEGLQGTEGDVPGVNEPDTEPTSAKGWLDAIRDAEKAFREYQDKSDNIDKQYANLARLAGTTRDREIQLFWANISVMAPSVYSRVPVPVVIPRWKQRDELPRTTSEMLERATIVTFEREDVDGVMRLIRDDLVILSRGVPWIRLDTTKGKERVCVEHADRKDWLCQPARNWKESDWVAKRSWLTKDQSTKRFGKRKAGKLDYAIRKDAKSDTDDGEQKAGVWELWCKSENKVVWVSEGCDEILDQGKPHLDLEDFFPCPKPAFGTLQRRSLVPVPDMVFYKDQLEEINEITARIAALTEAVRVRGFYPAGAGEIGDAIESALKATTNNQYMVPVSNWAMIGTGGVKDMIVWLPIDVITATITAIIAVRKQLIEDVYEVTGLSDIMRGQSEASETLGAQQLKSQYGSVRIKDKQDEMIRVARDMTRIVAEIIAEHYSGETLMDMTQMRLPSDADIRKQAAPLEKQLEVLQKQLPQLEQHLKGLQAEIQQAQSDPEVQQLAQANPDQAKQIIGQVQAQLQQTQQALQQGQQQTQDLQSKLQALAATVTIDKVMKLLREQKLRPFILDIETDSTIAPDENAAKQRATEFVTAVGGYLKNAMPLAQEMPQSAPMVAETLKFIVDQFRAGRGLQTVIDKFADDMEAAAQQPKPPSPEAIKAQQEAEAAKAKQAQDAEAAQADNAAKMAQAQKDQAEAAATAQEADTRTKDAELKRRIEEQRELDASNAKAAEREAALLEARTKAADAELKRRVDEQREADAARARDIEMTAKAAAAAFELQARREKHAQDMELAATKLEHERLALAGTVEKDKAAIAAHEATAAAAKAKPAPVESVQ